VLEISDFVLIRVEMAFCENLKALRPAKSDRHSSFSLFRGSHGLV